MAINSMCPSDTFASNFIFFILFPFAPVFGKVSPMTTPPLNLFQATPPFLEPASALFDLYRQFYGQPSDMEGARRFIGERLEKGDSAIFLAYSGDHPVGFFQLYPSFTSAWMQRVW